MSALKERVESIIAKHNLLEHPFYQSWSCGTLPKEQLTLYSSEYGTFIKQIASLWESCGYKDIADVEREHAILWNQFAQSLGTAIAESASVDQIMALNAFMSKACQDKASALGALLAFEYQQPTTVESKLKGLRTHYQSLNADEVYFEVHLDDWDEPGLIIKELEQLTETERERAMDSLETACQLLWDALTGIHETSMAA